MQRLEKTAQELNAITSRIIGLAIALHETFGPGLLETVYVRCLARDLVAEGFDVAIDYPIGLTYKDVHIACAFRADLIVHHCVLVELKAVEQVAPVHLRQITTYLKLADFRVGLLLNFGAATLKDGIYRRVNGFPD
jgi:GxxExxY protein